MNKILCYLGIHRPLNSHKYYFKNVISRKQIFKAKCPCGKIWMVDSIMPWLGTKVLSRNQDD